MRPAAPNTVQVNDAFRHSAHNRGILSMYVEKGTQVKIRTGRMEEVIPFSPGLELAQGSHTALAPPPPPEPVHCISASSAWQWKTHCQTAYR